MQPSDFSTILVVGSWGKEQMTLENLRTYGDYRLLAYMDTRNPGIIPLVQDHTIGKLTDVEHITKYAKSAQADIALLLESDTISRAHLFRIMTRYSGNSCYVARMGEKLAGWVMGFNANRMPDTYFLWQIGVNPEMQGNGIAGRLLEYVENDVRSNNGERIELTIDPENLPSERLFARHGYRNISASCGKTTHFNSNEAVINFYSPGRHFMVYEKIL